MSIMFIAMTVRDGGGDIYLTNAPVGCLKIPFRTYSLLKTCICIASSLNETSSNVQKLWFMLISTWEGKRCITETDALTLISPEFG